MAESGPGPLFTIGHSTHSLDHFLELLAQQNIRVVADVRRFPGSRKFPHFHQEPLSAALAEMNVIYHWEQALGGRRGASKESSSLNAGLRNPSFRNYADYMQTAEFREGVACLLEHAEAGPTAMMCAEAVFWRCHRRLVSDYLLALQIPVQHIMPSGKLSAHSPTSGVCIRGNSVTWPAASD